MSLMRSRAWLLASMFAGIAVLGVAAPAVAAPAYPQVDGRCVDQTAVLGSDLCAKVSETLLHDEQTSTDEIAVVIVPTTDDASIEEWSKGLFNSWEVGKKDKNNGVLLVAAIDDHKVRLETGRGLAKRLDNAAAVTIVAGITAHFKAGEIPLGLLSGLDAIRSKIGHKVAADAQLAGFAASATREATTDSGNTGYTSTDGKHFTGPDGSTLTVPDDADSSTSGGSVPWGLIVGGGIAIFAVIGLIFARVIGRSSPSRSSSSPWIGGRNYDSAQGVMSSSDSSSSSFTSSSYDSGSSSSSSSFGGGSSDGGGATGSW